MEELEELINMGVYGNPQNLMEIFGTMRRNTSSNANGQRITNEEAKETNPFGLANNE